MFDVLNNAAREGGKVLHAFFRKELLDVKHKTDHHNIVTMADLQSQEAIKQSLIEGMRHKDVGEDDIGFIGEENLHVPGTKEHIFVIDPLDGTSNFASGLDYFCTPIGYFRKGELVAGIILRPVTNEVFYAEKGQGAYVIREEVKTKLEMKPVDMKNTFVLTEAWTHVTKDPQMLLADKFLDNTRGLRILGAVAIDFMCLSENAASLVISKGPYIWDIAAGKIIIEEAGGAIYQMNGELLELDLSSPTKQYAIFACHPDRKAEIMEKITLS